MSEKMVQAGVSDAERSPKYNEAEKEGMAGFLKSIGYVRLLDGTWQDKRAYLLPKTMVDAYEFEIEIFR